MTRISVATLLLLSQLSLAASEVPPQLNIVGFATCLSSLTPQQSLEEIRSKYDLSNSDGLLLYLAVYPGRRFPWIEHGLQNVAHKKWSGNFEESESQLAQWLWTHHLSNSNITPMDLFRESLKICSKDAFCAALISHNTLRTLGRHQQAISSTGEDFNPHWFKLTPDRWISKIPSLQNQLIPLRRDGRGDRWGEWYHFFGVFTFTLHELAVNEAIDLARASLILNRVLNPLLAAGWEAPEKAGLDRDAVEVALAFARNTAQDESVRLHARSCSPHPLPLPGSCDLAQSYRLEP